MPAGPDLLRHLGEMADETLVELYDGLYDVIAADIMLAIRDLMWSRHAIAGGNWPIQRRLGLGEVEYEIIATCATCQKAGRAASVERHIDVTIAKRRFEGIMCSCGRRSDVSASSRFALNYSWRRRTPTAIVWPTRMVDDVPRYVVCRFASTADSPEHGPGCSQCLCQAYYSSDPDEHKLMPVH